MTISYQVRGHEPFETTAFNTVIAFFRYVGTQTGVYKVFENKLPSKEDFEYLEVTK